MNGNAQSGGDHMVDRLTAHPFTAGGGGGLHLRKLCNFSGKTLLIWATTLERKYYKIMLLA